jgi:hypothetical protein
MLESNTRLLRLWHWKPTVVGSGMFIRDPDFLSIPDPKTVIKEKGGKN